MTIKWEHDFNLSIHCYYVNELEAGFRACERVANSEAPDSIKQNVIQNMAFYIRPLLHYCNVKYTKLDSNIISNGWSLFNPTIINCKNGFLILIRSSNYKINENGCYEIPEEDGNLIRTEYIQLITDTNFKTLKEDRVTIPNYLKTNYPVDGLEDLRIFKSKTEYYVSGTIRNMSPFDGTCRISLAKYDPIDVAISSIKVLNLDNNRHEKNWMPINDDSSLLKWIYACNEDKKTKIINEITLIEDIDCDFSMAKNFRGGSQLIKINDKFYGIIHEVSHLYEKRVYYHRAVEWDNNFKISKVSKLFSIKDNNIIEFAAGMCFDGADIHITFGSKDKEAWVASLSLQDFYSLFY